jgi:hypothetical protein
MVRCIPCQSHKLADSRPNTSDRLCGHGLAKTVRCSLDGA